MARGKRVEIVKIIVDGAEVDAKACTKCGELKALTEFTPNRGSVGGVHNLCRMCNNERLRLRLREKARLENRKVRVTKGYRKWNKKTYAEYVLRAGKGEFEVLGDFVNVSSKVWHRHIACGHVYEVIPDSFIRGTRCPRCAGNIKKTTDQFKTEVFDLVGNDYKVLGDYTGDGKHLLIRHERCGREYSVLPGVFKGGGRCALCSGKLKKTTDQFKTEVFDLVGNDYKVLGEYVNAMTRIRLLHEHCGESYLVKPSNFLTGRRCPFCRESRGERAIRQYLLSYGCFFETQKTFDDCRNINKLRFDFVIYGDGRTIAVEYDGEQHTRPVDFAGKGMAHAQRLFTETKRRDRIKTDYCLANGIPLIRINHTEFDRIEEILTQRLAELGVTGKHLNGSNVKDSSVTSVNNGRSITKEDAA